MTVIVNFVFNIDITLSVDFTVSIVLSIAYFKGRFMKDMKRLWGRGVEVGLLFLTIYLVDNKVTLT